MVEIGCSGRRVACLSGEVRLWTGVMLTIGTCCPAFNLLAIVKVLEKLSCMC
jgi:hypothetical protein